MAKKKPTDSVREFAERYERRIAELEKQITESAGGTLTAEQVRKAIFSGSTYASYDGAQYYANGIRMQAIADELNAALGTEINGDTSDGYHTFNELYHHRAVLFSVIVASRRDMAWKSRKHHDGTMYDGMFIVGIDTPWGQASYHYDLEPYWDMFDCEERESAPEWDGHTPDQAIERIGKLATQSTKRDRTEEWLLNACNQAAADYIAELERKLEAATLGGGECELTMDGTDGNFGCSECLENIPPLANFCPNCGRKVVKR